MFYCFQGLYYTGNNSADLAAAWIFENQDKDLDAPLEVSCYLWHCHLFARKAPTSSQSPCLLYMMLLPCCKQTLYSLSHFSNFICDQAGYSDQQVFVRGFTSWQNVFWYSIRMPLSFYFWKTWQKLKLVAKSSSKYKSDRYQIQ